MYSRIKNPLTKRYVNINTKLGTKIIKNYIHYLYGGQRREKNQSYDTQEIANLVIDKLSSEGDTSEAIYLKKKLETSSQGVLRQASQEIEEYLESPNKESINSLKVDRTDSYDDLTEPQKELFRIPSSVYDIDIDKPFTPTIGHYLVMYLKKWNDLKNIVKGKGGIKGTGLLGPGPLPE